MRIFLRPHPRAFALVSNEFCLTVRYVNEAQECLVHYTPLAQTDLTAFEEINNRRFLGLIGLLTLRKAELVFFCVITDSGKVGSPRPGEDIYKVKEVEFYCLNSVDFDSLTDQRRSSSHNWDKYESEHPCSKLGKMLVTGFYYSRDFDITNVLQERGMTLQNYQQMYEDFEKKFLWNYFMMKELLKFRNRLLVSERDYLDKSELLTFLARGFVKTVNANEDSLLTIISKISCAKMDRSLALKGVDENGFVSNYIETETLYYNSSTFFSYSQVRGNVPLYYEIENPFLSNKKITFSNSKELNEIAFDKHFDSLMLKYGSVVVIDCLRSRPVEEELNNNYTYFLNKKRIPNIPIHMTRDQMRNSPHKVSHQLRNAVLEVGAFCYDFKKKVYIGKQLGVFRINSLNSMEKPGMIEKIISSDVLELSLLELDHENPDQSKFYHQLKIKHDLLWDENNSVLESIYERSIRKNHKKVFEGMFQKVALYDPFHDFISAELIKRQSEYSSISNISILAGTFNVNGEIPHDSISSWIHPAESNGADHDIVVIGLQEVVELTTSKMLVTDDVKKRFWELKIKKELNSNSSSKYSLIWSNQLGGIVLLFYVKDDSVGHIKEVNGMVKKTGFGGISANKGGVALSFQYSSTKFCFIVTHLAAGLENVEQRHNDFKNIAKTIRFSKDKRIKDHDSVIWMGDLNYRILLSNEQVREAIHNHNYLYLFEYDQLSNQMIAGEAFPYFNEMEIKFPPTYKFDKGTKNYDTSDKLRIPAWTDRILSRGSNLTQSCYNSAQDIVFSDHRPIYAVFKAEVKIINETMKHKLTKELYEDRKKELDQTGVNNVESLMLQQKQLRDMDGLALPPPSSDRAKWWIAGGLPAKVTLDIPPNVSMVNPLRPSNPFVETDEAPFI